MKHKFQLLSLLIYFFSLATPASTLDDYLRQRLDFFSVTPLEKLAPPQNAFQMELGKKLFIETDLSGNRNVSCHTCHNSKMGTSDALPLSQTEDGKGILKRNSSSLFNTGGNHNSFMFWDGRVHYQPTKKIFTTPEVALNGETPQASHITSVLSSALSAQALFPLLSMEEMKGKAGENEIPAAFNGRDERQSRRK